MNEPQPVLKPLDDSSKAALLGGAPLAIVSVWLTQNFFLPPDTTLDPTAAVAIGTVGATLFGELWIVFKRLLDKIGAPS